MGGTDTDDARRRTATGRLRSTSSRLPKVSPVLSPTARGRRGPRVLGHGMVFGPCRSTDSGWRESPHVFTLNGHQRLWPRAHREQDDRFSRVGLVPPWNLARPSGRQAAAEVFGRTQPRDGLRATARPVGRAPRRSPRKRDDGRPLDVVSGAAPSGVALLWEQVPVGSAEPLAACRPGNRTEGGWSMMTTIAAGSPAAQASAWRDRAASQVSHGGAFWCPRTGASVPGTAE